MGLLKRKSGNQRLKQRNVLDVKLSVAQVRRHRFRVLFFGTAALVAVILTVCVCWRTGELVLDRLVYENQNYTLQVLDIQTDGVISVEQIRRWAGVKTGDNLFALDLARIKRDLELFPGIQSVAVERVLPRTLRLHVQEREPVAQILTARMAGSNAPQSVVFLLDAESHVMLPLETAQRAVPPVAPDSYPVITGASPAQLSPGHQADSPQIRAAMRLLTAWEHSPMAGLVELTQIDVASPEVLVVTTDQQSEVALRSQDLERQLNRWRLVFDLGVRQGNQIASLDLSVSDNIPLRWQEPGAAPPPGPKIRKTSPYRKKHV
jgi:hypothetical protein